MQRATQQVTRKKSGGGAILLSLVLAIVLGLGGYFGVNMLMSGNSPMDALGLGDGVSVGGVPTDSEGNNLTGNTMQNLYAGGLTAMQGEDLFYANPADGGALYCRARDGEITKLTDFPVANLNVSGERMVFTDLEASTIIRADGGMDTYAATSHEELRDEAGEYDHINYGGHLYFIMGIKSFCAGDISYEELTIAGLDSEERYQSPIMMEGGDILVIAMSPGGEASDVEADPVSAAVPAPKIVPLSLAVAPPLGIMPVQALSGADETPHGTSRPLNPNNVSHTSSSVMAIRDDGSAQNLGFDTSEGDVVQSAVAVGDSVYVVTGNEGATGDEIANSVTEIDRETGKPKGTVEGHSLQANGADAYFMNDGNVYKANPVTGKISQVSGPSVNSSRYTLNPDNSVSYQTKDKDTGEMVDVTMLPTTDGGYMTTLGPYEGKVVAGPPDKKNRGGNDLQWLDPGGLGDLFSSANKKETEAPPPPLSDAKKGTPEGIPQDLSMIISYYQGYSLSDQQTDDLFNRGDFDTLVRYRPDVTGMTLNDSMDLKEADVMTIIRDILEGPDDLAPDVRNAVDSFLKLADYSFGECTVSADGMRGEAQFLVSQRVHITSENYSLASGYAVNSVFGGAAEMQRAAENPNFAEFDQQEREFDITRAKNLGHPAYLEQPTETVTIPVRYEPDLGWRPESYEQLFSELFVIDPNVELLRDVFNEAIQSGRTDPDDPGSSPNSSDDAIPSGTYYRSVTDMEYIEINGSNYTWYMAGRVIRSGTYDIQGSSITFSDIHTWDDFSQSGGSIYFNDWEYILK